MMQALPPVCIGSFARNEEHAHNLLRGICILGQLFTKYYYGGKKEHSHLGIFLLCTMYVQFVHVLTFTYYKI
jgi:hypothetical protein